MKRRSVNARREDRADRTPEGGNGREESLRVAQHLQDTLSEMLVDFGVSGNGLGYLRGGVVIPVVLPTMANKYAATRFELPDQILPLH